MTAQSPSIADQARRTVIARRVRTILAGLADVPPDALADARRLDDDLGLDSLGFIDAIVCCETEFGIEIADEAAAQVATVGDLVTLVARLAR